MVDFSKAYDNTVFICKNCKHEIIEYNKQLVHLCGMGKGCLCRFDFKKKHDKHVYCGCTKPERM